jgi:hypothetical protein
MKFRNMTTEKKIVYLKRLEIALFIVLIIMILIPMVLINYT